MKIINDVVDICSPCGMREKLFHSAAATSSVIEAFDEVVQRDLLLVHTDKKDGEKKSWAQLICVRPSGNHGDQSNDRIAQHSCSTIDQTILSHEDPGARPGKRSHLGGSKGVLVTPLSFRRRKK
jgi:hypothetical protein